MHIEYKNQTLLYEYPVDDFQFNCVNSSMVSPSFIIVFQTGEFENSEEDVKSIEKELRERIINGLNIVSFVGKYIKAKEIYDINIELERRVENKRKGHVNTYSHYFYAFKVDLEVRKDRVAVFEYLESGPTEIKTLQVNIENWARTEVPEGYMPRDSKVSIGDVSLYLRGYYYLTDKLEIKRAESIHYLSDCNSMPAFCESVLREEFSEDKVFSQKYIKKFYEEFIKENSKLYNWACEVEIIENENNQKLAEVYFRCTQKNPFKDNIVIS